MQRSLLEVYLSKVSAGDLAYLERLCAQLADRLCYVPALTLNKDSHTTRVEPVRLTIAGRPFVALFTTEKKFKTWQEAHPEIQDSITVLGGDLCAAISHGTGIVVDAESENSVELAAETVRKIADDALAEEAERAEEFAQYEAKPVASDPKPIPEPSEVTDSSFDDVLGAGQGDPHDPFFATPPGFESSKQPSGVFVSDEDNGSSTVIVDSIPPPPRTESKRKSDDRHPLADDSERGTRTFQPDAPTPESAVDEPVIRKTKKSKGLFGFLRGDR